MTLPDFASLGLVTQGTEEAWAIADDVGRYRYALGRSWHSPLIDPTPKPTWVFGMLNPSVARHDKEDPTLRKCIGFAKRGGAGGLIVVNLLAFSTPYVRDMVAAWRGAWNIQGPHNEAMIRWAVKQGRKIAAWGKVPPRLRHIAALSADIFVKSGVECLGTNGDGTPCHPLMLPYATPLIEKVWINHSDSVGIATAKKAKGTS